MHEFKKLATGPRKINNEIEEYKKSNKTNACDPDTATKYD